MVNYRICFDDFVLGHHYFLTKITSAALVVELMHNFVGFDDWLTGEDLVDDISEFHCLLKCNNKKTNDIISLDKLCYFNINY